MASGTADLGKSVETALIGVFDITKVGSQAWAAGARVCWDNTGVRVKLRGKVRLVFAKMVRDLSLSGPSGVFLLRVGPSGSGQSALPHMLTALDRAPRAI